MPHTIPVHAIDAWDEYLDEIEGSGRPSRRTSKRTHSTAADERASLLAEGDPAEGSFDPSFTGSRHEREWILTYLSPFYRDQLITDVLRVVKGGKEATVYCCRAHPATGLDLIAAKVYRPKIFRTFKNDADYRQGRPVLSGEGKAVRERRYLKAVNQGTRFGQQARHASWLAHEYSTLQALYDDGADVPKPIAHDENAILMAYLGEELAPAPTLSQVRLDPGEVRPLFGRLMRDVELMLRHDRVHGDLSAYNVLYWEGTVTIIDFPQVIDAYGNPDAFRFLQRDVERLCGYFARHSLNVDAASLARDMWRRTMPDETFQIRGSRAGW